MKGYFILCAHPVIVTLTCLTKHLFCFSFRLSSPHAPCGIIRHVLVVPQRRTTFVKDATAYSDYYIPTIKMCSLHTELYLDQVVINLNWVNQCFTLKPEGWSRYVAEDIKKKKHFNLCFAMCYQMIDEMIVTVLCLLTESYPVSPVKFATMDDVEFMRVRTDLQPLCVNI